MIREKDRALYQVAEMMATSINEDLETRFCDREIILAIESRFGRRITQNTLRRWSLEKDTDGLDWKAKRKRERIRVAKTLEVMTQADTLGDAIRKIGKKSVGMLAKRLNIGDVTTGELARLVQSAMRAEPEREGDKEEIAELAKRIHFDSGGLGC